MTDLQRIIHAGLKHTRRPTLAAAYRAICQQPGQRQTDLRAAGHNQAALVRLTELGFIRDTWERRENRMAHTYYPSEAA